MIRRFRAGPIPSNPALGVACVALLVVAVVVLVLSWRGLAVPPLVNAAFPLVLGFFMGYLLCLMVGGSWARPR
jgi:hypothetical protein